MTLEEAEKLAVIFNGVDGGCISCVENVCLEATQADLGFIWQLDSEMGSYPGTVFVTAKESEAKKATK